MFTSLAPLLLLTLGLLMPTSQPTSRPYQNPVVRGLAPDPSICRVDDDYYLAVSTMNLYPGVPILHSRDLTNWRVIGHALTTPGQMCVDKNHGEPMMFAPTLRHRGGKFYLVCTDVHGGGNFIVTADDAFGPWSEPKFVDQPMFDPSLFWDIDGTCYYTRRGDSRHQDIVQATIDPDTGQLTSPLRSVGRGMVSNDAEAPHLFRRGDWYYLTQAEGGSRALHMQTIGRSKSPWGPFDPCPANPIVSQHHAWGDPIHALGHADFFDDADGRWWAVCLGTRHAAYDAASVIGRETFLLPVTWHDDWPVVPTDAMRQLDVAAAPLPVEHDCPVPHPTDDFGGKTLGLTWALPHYPRRPTYSLTARPGFLRLLPGPDLAMVGQRQTEMAATFAAAVDYRPTERSHEAGVTVYQTAEFRYDLARTVRDGRSVIVLRKTVGDVTAESAPVAVPDGPVQLRVVATPKAYTFAWSTDGKTWHDVGTARPQLIGTETAAVWSGVLVGVYAAGGDGGPPADVDWCRYTTP